MHHEQQKTLLTPPEINGLESMSFCGMEDVNTKSSLTPQIAGPGPIVFFQSSEKSLARTTFFSSHQISKNLLLTSFSFSFDELSHHSECRPLAGMQARRVCKPNGLCLEQQQVNNGIQQ